MKRRSEPQQTYTCYVCPQPKPVTTSIDPTRAFENHYMTTHMEKPDDDYTRKPADALLNS